jgi:hypothetical protein
MMVRINNILYFLHSHIYEWFKSLYNEPNPIEKELGCTMDSLLPSPAEPVTGRRTTSNPGVVMPGYVLFPQAAIEFFKYRQDNRQFVGFSLRAMETVKVSV